MFFHLVNFFLIERKNMLFAAYFYKNFYYLTILCSIHILLIIKFQYFQSIHIFIFCLKHLAFRLEETVFALVEL